MRKLFVFVSLILVSTFCFAEAQNGVYLKDNNILIESNNENKLTENNEMISDSAGTNNNEDAAVQNALNVFKNKSSSGSEESTWIVEKSDGTKTIIVGKEYDDSKNTLVFSSDGSKAFYTAVDADGVTVLYGYDVDGAETYSFGGTQSFGIADCPNNDSYVVVHKDGEEISSYHVYDVKGNDIETITYTGDISDISDVVCY